MVELTRYMKDPVVDAKDQIVRLVMRRHTLTEPRARELVDKAYSELDTKDDVSIRYNLTEPNGDVVTKESTTREYLKAVKKQDIVLVPTWTTYTKDPEVPAPEAEIVSARQKSRAKHKKLAFEALMNKDKEAYEYEDTFQIAEKTVSNSISGGISVGGSALQNPNTHSTLTSTPRISTSTTNACVERNVTGHLHLKDVNTTLGYLGNVIQVCSNPERERQIMDTISRFSMRYPTADEAFQFISSEANKYWVNTKALEVVREIIYGLSDIELAFIFYNGSLFGIWKLNSTLIETFFNRWITKCTAKPQDDDLAYLKGLTEEEMSYVVHRFSDILKGDTRQMDEYEEQLLADMRATAENYLNAFEEFRPLFETFLMTDVLSPNVADYRETIRDSVIVNDTDSGIYHVGTWVAILLGNSSIINEDSFAICGVFAHMNSILIINALELLSYNMNLLDPKSGLIEMKSEMTMETLGVPSGSKHYHASAAIIEGNVLPEPKLIKKGVGLRNSALPSFVRNISDDIIKDIPASIRKDNMLDINKYVNLIKSVEKTLHTGLLDHVGFYKQQEIKSESSNLVLWYDFWMDSVLSRNNEIEIPLIVVKIPTTITSKSVLNKFLDSIEDEQLQKDIRAWCTKHKRTNLARVYLPKDLLVTGVPEWLREWVDRDLLVKDICKIFYILLETLGVNKNPLLTLTDHYPYDVI